MAVKEAFRVSAGKLRRELRETGRVVLHAPALVRGAECVIRFLLGAILSGAEVLGDASPFGLALVASSGSGTGGLAALLGFSLGILSLRGFTEGLRYVAAAVLIFSVSFAFYDLKAYRSRWFMPAMAALLSGCTGFVYLSAGRWSVTSMVLFGGELLLTAAGTYFYRMAFEPWGKGSKEAEGSTRQTISGLILAVTVLIALAGMSLPGGLSVGRLCATLAVIMAAHLGGVGVGVTVGICCGIAMDLAAGGIPYYSMVYTFAGLLSGVFWKQGKLFSTLAYVLGSGVAVLWTWESGGGILPLYECFIASVCFLLLPESLLRRVSALLAQKEREVVAHRAGEYVRERLEATAAAFRDLAGSLKSSFRPKEQNDGDGATIFDRAAGRVCRACTLRNACWQREYSATYCALNDALPEMITRGRGLPADFPEHFRSRCVKFPSFLSACNEELSALLARKAFESRLGESRSAVCRQYGDVADILSRAASELASELTPDLQRAKQFHQYLLRLDLDGEVAVFYDQTGRLRAQAEGRGLELLAAPEKVAELAGILAVRLKNPLVKRTGGGVCITFEQSEPLKAEAELALRQKTGETVSGDSAISFTGEDGVLYVLLCDGMGSGEAAHKESALAIHLLERFLKAGVAPEAALKTLNSALALRCEAEGAFTTVDLLTLDLLSGCGAVYKYGAAPTYLVKGGAVTRMVGGALPAGLLTGAGTGPDVCRFEVAPGDWVALLSDGVLAEDDLWLRELLRGCGAGSPSELAARLVAQDALAMDDKTAAVVRFSKNEV